MSLNWALEDPSRKSNLEIRFILEAICLDIAKVSDIISHYGVVFKIILSEVKASIISVVNLHLWNRVLQGFKLGPRTISIAYVKSV